MQLPVPALRVPVHVSDVLAVTVTFPVGVPAPGTLAFATLKVTVTACPITDGLGVFEMKVVALAAWFTLIVVLPAAAV